MTSPAKIEANRQNSRKSTGPRSDRGKASMRLNALRLGIYATSRLLPGENASVQRKVTTDFFNEFRPVGPVQKILTDQMIGAYWRLARIERAESVFFREIKASQIGRFIREHDRGAKRPSEESKSNEIKRGDPDFLDDKECHQTSSSNSKTDWRNWHNYQLFRRLADWDSVILEGLVPALEERPKKCLDQQRRAAIRDLMLSLSRLRQIQTQHTRTLEDVAASAANGATRI